MKTTQPFGVAPETGKEFCVVVSHPDRATVIRHLRLGNGPGRCMAAAFVSAEDLTSWVGGKGVLQKVSRGGPTVWITDKTRRVKDGVSYWVPAGKWVGYRWLHDDPLVREILNANTERLTTEAKGQKNK